MVWVWAGAGWFDFEILERCGRGFEGARIDLELNSGMSSCWGAFGDDGTGI